jgi:hypothetical protein
MCCIGYQKVGDEFKEVVTPFHEWREYLSFLKNTQVLCSGADTKDDQL